MKAILLRNVLDHSRFVGRRGWISKKYRARNFSTVHAALCFCAEHDLDDTEVLIHFGEPNAADVIVTVEADLAPCGAAVAGWGDGDHNVAYV